MSPSVVGSCRRRKPCGRRRRWPRTTCTLDSVRYRILLLPITIHRSSLQFCNGLTAGRRCRWRCEGPRLRKSPRSEPSKSVADNLRSEPAGKAIVVGSGACWPGLDCSECSIGFAVYLGKSSRDSGVNRPPAASPATESRSRLRFPSCTSSLVARSAQHVDPSPRSEGWSSRCHRHCRTAVSSTLVEFAFRPLTQAADLNS